MKKVINSQHKSTWDTYTDTMSLALRHSIMPDMFQVVCQWFSPRQLRNLLQTNKVISKALLEDNQGYWELVAVHMLFRRLYIVELPDLDKPEDPLFDLKMPDDIPVHNLFSMKGLDISRGEAMQMFLTRLRKAIDLNAQTAPWWQEYQGLTTRQLVLKHYHEKLDHDVKRSMPVENIPTMLGGEAKVMRTIASMTMKEDMFPERPTTNRRIRLMDEFVNSLEDDSEITPAIKRKLMRKLFRLARDSARVPGRVYSFRETCEFLCQF